MLLVMSKRVEKCIWAQTVFLHTLYILYTLYSLKNSLKSEYVLIVARVEHLNSVLYAYIR